MSDFLARLVAIAEAETRDEVWRLATEWFAALGFSRVNYGYTRFRSAHSLGDPEDVLYLSTADPNYVKAYFRNNFYARTPVFRWAEANVGACTWAWVRKALEAGELTSDEMETLRINHQLGVTAGISVSFPTSSSRSKGAIGLIADLGLTTEDVEEIWRRERDRILSVAHMLHLRLLQFPLSSGRRKLTARQREVLEWIADGKTTQDVAVILGLSVAMVEKHLRLAREALDVETTAQAVAKATLLNLIYNSTRDAGSSGVVNPR